MCAYLHVPTCQLLTETSFLNCRTNDILPVDIVATGALNNYFDKIINLQNDIKPLIVCPEINYWKRRLLLKNRVSCLIEIAAAFVILSYFRSPMLAT